MTMSQRRRFARLIVLTAAALAANVSLARVTDQTPPGWPKTKDRVEGEISQVKVDPRIADYRRVTELSGKIRSVGSSTLSNLMNRWGEAFKLIYPKVEIDITGGGSGIALTALLEGKPGDVIYLPKGSKVVFGTPSRTKIFYVTYPADWAKPR